MKKKQKLQLKMITAGDHHAAVLSEDKQAFFWGRNANGQLGLNDTFDYSETPTLNTLLETLEVS